MIVTAFGQEWRLSWCLPGPVVTALVVLVIPFLLVAYLQKPQGKTVHETDPSLLKQYSSFETYTTIHATYRSVRTFCRPHPQAQKLPLTPKPLPLLVFIHGLGGSLAQFHPLLGSLVDVAPCLGIDLPGCGRSAFTTSNWAAYTQVALAALVRNVIDKHLGPEQGFVLIGHSLGCSLAARVAATYIGDRDSEVLGLIGICPLAEPIHGRLASIFKLLLSVPTPIFDLWRAWDRRAGPYSPGIAKFVGQNADIEVKKLQETFNAQSQTPVFRRMAWGSLSHGKNRTGAAGLETWAKLGLPMFLIGGAADAITKVDQIAKIAAALGREPEHPEHDVQASSEQPLKPTTDITMLPASSTHHYYHRQPSNISAPLHADPYTIRLPLLKTTILPPPASHALLYDPSTSPTLLGLIHAFLHSHIDTRLSLRWQHHYLLTQSPWSIKNLARWRSTPPISPPIGGIFRAMKTPREIDPAHNPTIFTVLYGDNSPTKKEGDIRAVLDISSSAVVSPAYDPRGLERGGIAYYRYPTSPSKKIPPSRISVAGFVNLVNQLRATYVINDEGGLLGVHGQYGYDRTGFLICAYLVEQEGYGVKEAVELFASKRPPGIRHVVFLEELWARYGVCLMEGGG